MTAKKQTNKTSSRDENGKLIQDLPDHINHDDLETLEIIGNPETVEKAIRYLQENLPFLSVTFHDFIDLIGLKTSTYSEDDLYQASIWAKANSIQKQSYMNDPSVTPEKIKIFEEIIASDKEKGQKLLEIILSLAQLWGNSDMKKAKLTNDAFTIISKATGLSIELIKNSDYTISAEIFLGIIFKPQDCWNKCFFLNRATANLTKTLQL